MPLKLPAGIRVVRAGVRVDGRARQAAAGTGDAAAFDVTGRARARACVRACVLPSSS